MYRKIIKELENFKNESKSLPIMIIGARQIGKTYVIEEFARNEYENYIKINFEEQPEFKSVFEENLVSKDIISRIELLLGKEINIENTLIFFDEIQVCPKAVTSLKYFSESKENYKIVCAGSLLGVALKREKVSFPVGKVKTINMYQLDFEEFLIAIGQEKLISEIRKCYNNKVQMLEPIHNRLIKFYTDYLYVGGMPDAVLNYINSEFSIIRVDKTIAKNIINNYIADMSKYVDGSTETIKLINIYQSLPKQLNRENIKFKYKIISEFANKRDYDLPITWLTSSGIVLKSNNLDSINVPLSAGEDINNFKMYMADTGLLTAMAGSEYLDLVEGADNTFKGSVVENYVAVQFISMGFDLLYYKPNKSIEIDFLIRLGRKNYSYRSKSRER
ncbi:MAG: ATP-binding protein [Oscillospiraceae bacterium]|nr:ATP-binding protein [Oscillospiraceae bacterium]